MRYYTKYSAKYLVFPTTFRVMSRKIDYLWDNAVRSSSRYMLGQIRVVGGVFHNFCVWISVVYV